MYATGDTGSVGVAPQEVAISITDDLFPHIVAL
jgi:hypothetical protein